jgi:hypothetical protein
MKADRWAGLHDGVWCDLNRVSDDEECREARSIHFGARREGPGGVTNVLGAARTVGGSGTGGSGSARKSSAPGHEPGRDPGSSAWERSHPLFGGHTESLGPATK